MLSRWWWIFLAMMVPMACLGAMVVGGIALLVPKRFDSLFTLQAVDRSAERLVEVSSDEIGALVEDRFDEVVDRLNLAAVWDTSRSEAIARLAEAVETDVIRGTDLVTVTVGLSDANQSVQVAQALMEEVQRAADGNDGFNPIVIHEEPVASRRPAAPNVPLLAVMGAGGGVIFSPFVSLGVMALLERRYQRKRRLMAAEPAAA